jgi:hypothetical protein
MKTNKHGYVPAALMMNNLIRDMRSHVEFEKFLCRTIKDNETTREFRKNTENHKNSLYRFWYNSTAVEEHTIAGKAKVNASKQPKS